MTAFTAEQAESLGKMAALLEHVGVIVAWSRGEISEGRACELTGWTRDYLRRETYSLVSRITGKANPDAEAEQRRVAIEAHSTFVTDFVNQYEFYVENGTDYQPSDFERQLLHDCIAGLHGSGDYWKASDRWRDLCPPAQPHDFPSLYLTADEAKVLREAADYIAPAGADGVATMEAGRADQVASLLRGMADRSAPGQFTIGTPVKKYTGDYQLAGTVVGTVRTLAGKLRIVVEHAPAAPGMLHIYAPTNIIPDFPEPAGDVVDAEIPLDDFKGDTPQLVKCIDALLNLDAKGAVAPHGIGGHARVLLAAAASRLKGEQA